MDCPEKNDLLLPALVKDEPCDIVYQKFPWDETVVQEEEKREHTLIEYDNTGGIKTEIEIEEPVLQTPDILPPPIRTRAPRTKSKPKTVKKQSQQFVCEICNKKFTTQHGCNGHTRCHPKELPFECRVCTQRFSEDAKRMIHEKSCSVRRFECYLCRFTSLHAHFNRFLVHFRRHTGEKPFKCKSCAKQFTSIRMLNHHMKYHPNEILTKCSFCQRKFSNSTEAKTHESNCSLNRRMECYLCKSSFKYISSLKRHMPQHTGQNSFICGFCKKGFVRKDYLDYHTHKKHAKEMKLQCMICKLRFSQTEDMEKHKPSCKKKNVFTCDLCDYSTVSQIYAEDHKQQHVGEDEFKCMHCSKVFLQRSKLVHHVKTHNRKSKFECPHCQKPYIRWLFMEKHKNICPKRNSYEKSS